jgi:hypothetical protein
MKFWFHRYKKRPNLSSYAIWVSVLVHTVSELRDRIETDLIGPPTWFGRPCCPPKVVAKVENVLHHS